MKNNSVDREEITKIAKEFSEPFYEMTGGIEGSGWVIADPLSAYLSFCGWENKLDQIPENDEHPQILIMTFKDGSKFIPAGADLKKVHQDSHNWMWI